MNNDTKKMHILQISTADFGGGAEKSARYLFEAYRARGFKSNLAVGYKKSNDPDIIEIPRISNHHPGEHFFLRLYDQLLPLEGRIRGISYFRNWIHAFAGGWPRIETELGFEDFHYPGSWKLLDLVPEKPDIVHAHNLHGGYFDLNMLPWLSHQTPVILNLRDAWLLSGHCAHSFDCERWKTGCGHCPDLTIYPSLKRDATRFNWLRKKKIYNRSCLYISTPSQWLMEKVNLSMLQGVDYRIIPNGIDLNIFHPGDKEKARQDLGLPLQSKIVLFVAYNARRSRWKDYLTMEESIKLVANANDRDLIFLCLGEEGIEQEFGKAKIIYKGFENEKERMLLYYQAADLYIHAAKEDTFPRTILEALACGLPVVATAVGGIPEQIKDGVTGFLVPPKDAEAMAYRIEKLLEDGDLRQNFSTAAAEDAFVRFGLGRQVDSFLNWYQEIIERNKVFKD